MAAVALALAATSPPSGDGGAARAAEPSAHALAAFGAPPPIPEGPLSPTVRDAVRIAFVDSVAQSRWGPEHSAALLTIGRSEDPRLAWLITDLMRFAGGRELRAALTAAGAQLLGDAVRDAEPWGAMVDRLIAWDVPAPPHYLRLKRGVFTGFLPGLEALFVDGAIDWRQVSWGGVLIDDRPFGETDEPCNCIPAADDPEVTSAAEAAWLDDDAVVFGVVVNGEARAYPRRIMEVREMVNDTLGGRDLGIPYCTLCGAAQAYFTDRPPPPFARLVLRTSGLLIRSNKVMYDIVTDSVFDTFRGVAVTGPLAEAGVRLQQASVVTATWGDWRRAHPDTTVLAERLALGRDPDFRNGRDANGPIFPIGDVDPRLPVHEDVIGAFTASGRPVAFQRGPALLALRRGEEIAVENVRLVLEAGGLRAVDESGADLGSHEAFWFAWSQFHPGTALWPD